MSAHIRNAIEEAGGWDAQMHLADRASAYSQHSFLKSLILHILPGALLTLGMFLLKPIVDQVNYPPLLAFLAAVLLIDLPVMWGIMLFEGKKHTGQFSLEGVVLYKNKLPWQRFLFLFIATFVVAYLLIFMLSPVTDYLTNSALSGLPPWLFFEEQSQYLSYTKTALLTTFTIQLILTGVLLPWTEELYFRGYLMPRLSRYGKWTPLVGGMLFSFYHLWQPFSFMSVFLLGTVLAYVVWWQCDLRLAVSLHIVANSITRIIFLMAALSM